MYLKRQILLLKLSIMPYRKVYYIYIIIYVDVKISFSFGRSLIVHYVLTKIYITYHSLILRVVHTTERNVYSRYKVIRLILEILFQRCFLSLCISISLCLSCTIKYRNKINLANILFKYNFVLEAIIFN